MHFSLKNKLMFLAVAIFILFLTAASFFSSKKTPSEDKFPPAPPVVTLAPTRSPSFIQSDTRKQESADAAFGEEMLKIQTAYPWRDSLPLIDVNYYVYFDFEKKVFIPRIYSKSNNLSVAQVEDIKREILLKFSQRGIPTTQYPIAWNVGL